MMDTNIEPVLMIVKSADDGYRCLFEPKNVVTTHNGEDILAAIFFDPMKRHELFAQSVIIASARFYESKTPSTNIS